MLCIPAQNYKTHTFSSMASCFGLSELKASILKSSTQKYSLLYPDICSRQMYRFALNLQDKQRKEQWVTQNYNETTKSKISPDKNVNVNVQVIWMGFDFLLFHNLIHMFRYIFLACFQSSSQNLRRQGKTIIKKTQKCIRQTIKKLNKQQSAWEFFKFTGEKQYQYSQSVGLKNVCQALDVHDI